MKKNNQLKIDYHTQELNLELTQIISNRDHSTDDDIQSLRKDSKIKISQILSAIEPLSEKNKSRTLIKTLDLVKKCVAETREIETSHYIDSVFNDKVKQEFAEMKNLDIEIIKQLVNSKKENIISLKNHIENPSLSRQEAKAYSIKYRKAISEIIQYLNAFIKKRPSSKSNSVMNDFKKELKKLKSPNFKQRVEFGSGISVIIINFFRRVIMANSIKIGSWFVFIFISLIISTPALIFFLLKIVKRKHVGLHSVLIDISNKTVANIPVVKKLNILDIENLIYELIWTIKPTGTINKYKKITAKEIEIQSNLEKSFSMIDTDIQWRVKENAKDKREKWELQKKKNNE